MTLENMSVGTMGWLAVAAGPIRMNGPGIPRSADRLVACPFSSLATSGMALAIWCPFGVQFSRESGRLYGNG